MERTPVQKLARVLRVLVMVIFACNILALFMVPMLAVGEWSSAGAGAVEWGLDILRSLFNPKLDQEARSEVFVWIGYMFMLSWPAVFEEAYTAVLTVFLWSCGVCTAVILWQGKRVLDTVLAGEPFSVENAANLRRASVCCFVISGAALARLVWGLAYYASVRPLLTYNALFVPVFSVGGLLFLVMSALFRQAAELKAENDLTI